MALAVENNNIVENNAVDWWHNIDKYKAIVININNEIITQQKQYKLITS